MQRMRWHTALCLRTTDPRMRMLHANQDDARAGRGNGRREAVAACGIARSVFQHPAAHAARPPLPSAALLRATGIQRYCGNSQRSSVLTE